MSAAAVSQQVLALETHLGRPLFERAANRVNLTAEGADFLPTVQASLGAIESKAESSSRGNGSNASRCWRAS